VRTSQVNEENIVSDFGFTTDAPEPIRGRSSVQLNEFRAAAIEHTGEWAMLPGSIDDVDRKGLVSRASLVRRSVSTWTGHTWETRVCDSGVGVTEEGTEVPLFTIWVRHTGVGNPPASTRGRRPSAEGEAKPRGRGKPSAAAEAAA
jgi:hypothetical protein